MMHSFGVSFSTRVPAVPAKRMTFPITSDRAVVCQDFGSLPTLATTLESLFAMFQCLIAILIIVHDHLQLRVVLFSPERGIPTRVEYNGAGVYLSRWQLTMA